jgi:TetR/AcrR family transcriptional repressor of nem operon
MARRNTIPTRDRIVEAARYLFWERGYSATGMADILKRARARSGSFYYFFDSKGALLDAVLDSYLAAMEGVIVAPVFSRHRDPLDRIFGILTGYRQRLLATDCTYGCPLGRLAFEIDPKNRSAFAKIAANFDGWTGVVLRCLEDAGDRLPAGLDRDGLSKFVLTVMEGAVMQARVHRSIALFDASVNQLRDYFKRLLGGARPRAKVRRRSIRVVQR